MEVDGTAARGVTSAIGQTGCIVACHDGLTEGTEVVGEVVAPMHVCVDIHRHFVPQPRSRTKVRKSADGFGPHASTVVPREQAIERACRPGGIAGNLAEGSSTAKPGAGSSSAGRCPSSRSRPVAVIVMTGSRPGWFQPVAAAWRRVRLGVCANTLPAPCLEYSVAD